MKQDFLNEIIDYKKSVIKRKKPYYENLFKKINLTRQTRYQTFKSRISLSGQINLIAEIKKASPSKGLIRNDFDALSIARVYEQAGAQALSVLTEDKYFLGSMRYLKMICDNAHVPVLQKDFILDEGQIYEAFSLGASAVLLIAAILDDRQIRALKEKAENFDIDCLVEVHDREELDRALQCGADIIGVNNRNLRTFEVDIKTCDDLIPRVPKDKVTVAESGIASHDEIIKLSELGTNAVLIGEAFMKEANISQEISRIMRGES